MYNPIEIEKRFQNLLLRLSLPSSSQMHLIEIQKFFETLGNNYLINESYLLQLSERLPGLIQNLKCEGLDPEILKRLIENIENIKTSLNADGLSYAIRELRFHTSALYTYVGELRYALLLFDKIPEQDLPEQLIKLIDEPTSHPELVLKKIKEEFPNLDEELKIGIDRILELISKYSIPIINSALVPVIEYLITKPEQKVCLGGLRRITVNILGESKNVKDDIHWDVSIFGAETNLPEIINTPVSAARKLLSETYPHINKSHFTGQVIFDEVHTMHEGSSANLATAALIYCAILNFANNREQYQISSDVAITGNIDQDGNVLPIDDNTLSTKINTAFFSYIKYLVIHKDQLQPAESILNKLKVQYPKKDFTIIGVSKLREIFYDRRLTKFERAGVIKYTAKNVWRRKFTAAGILIIIFLLLALAKILYGPIDKNPFSAIIKGQNLAITNRNGETLEEIPVSAEVVYRISNSNLIEKYVKFYDINKDGINEIIWTDFKTLDPKSESKIQCRFYKQDSLNWSYTIKRKLDFPFNPIEGEYFQPNDFILGDFDKDGKLEIFLCAVHLNSPSLIIKLDALSGKELGHYVHIGHLQSLNATDINNDGIDEILSCGMNNAFEKACFFILDPRYLSGHSPLKGKYILNNYAPASELYYLLIPRTIVGEVFKIGSISNVTGEIQVLDSNKIIMTGTNDLANCTIPKKYGVEAAKYYIYFNFELNPLSFQTESRYDNLEKQLYVEHLISLNPDDNYKYFEEYKKTILYWNGIGWQNEPTMNSRYVNLVKGK
jgi:hypothetical protein